MKKTKKFIAGLALSALLLTGCNLSSREINSNGGGQQGGKQQDVYMLYKAAGGTMTYEEWLKTVKGEDGASVLAGQKDPAASEGKDGDVYINTSTWDLFIKLKGSWQKLGCIRGADGKDGKEGDEGKEG